MDTQQKVVIAGGSGFLGRPLARWFAERDWAVTVLSRRPGNIAPRVRSIGWDGESLGDWTQALEGAAAVIDLAGRSVNCRYTRANRREIMQSRVRSTRVIGEAIAACSSPPAVWLNSSTATIYRHSIDRPMDDVTGEIGATAEANDAFSIEVATTWERTVDEACTPRTRKAKLRIAMVLAFGRGGVFDVLHRLVRCGLGGTMGPGNQFVSWIHGDDFCRSIEWLIEHGDLSGPVNIAAPNPLPNRELMRLLRRLCRMPIGLPAASWMLEIGAFFLRTETELILKSRRVVPRRLLDSGFQFQFADAESALAEILRRSGCDRTSPSPREQAALKTAKRSFARVDKTYAGS
ncbi:MAG TPA: TIGR01777 family oxidoreductase [Pirellulales bacterium]|jgi:hypothetical protein|nr:TIGR01777 family oxidoreductase [Pirellulales bacterium]